MSYLLARRFVQVSLMAMFALAPIFGYTHLVRGNLSFSMFFDKIPLADPFAVFQILLTGHWVPNTVWLGAALSLVLYAILTGRTFCSWICPMNLVSDLAAWLNRKFGEKNLIQIPKSTRWIMLGLSVALTLITGITAFEWISPIGIAQRLIIIGSTGGLMLIVAIFVMDGLLVRGAWCGHLCPLGAFYSLVSRKSLLGVRFDANACTKCMRCTKLCPEPHVIKPLVDGDMNRRFVLNSDCTNCGRCLDVCRDDALAFALKPFENSSEVES